MSMQRATVGVNGIDLYFERAGTGTPLLFISGSGSDLRNKPNQFDAPIAEKFDLICYDQRGLGRTDNPSGNFSMTQYADDAAALLDVLGIEQIDVVGVSFGGMVAQELALRHPHKIKKLVLACTSSGGAGGASYPLHELRQIPANARAKQRLQISDLQHSDEWIIAHPEKWQKRFEFTLEQALNEDAAIARFSEQNSVEEYGPIKQLEARRGHDTHARLAQIEAPVLLVGGNRDGIAPVQNMQAIQAQIPQAEIEFFNGGHMFLIQDKAAYPFIIDWLLAAQIGR